MERWTPHNPFQLATSAGRNPISARAAPVMDQRLAWSAHIILKTVPSNIRVFLLQGVRRHGESAGARGGLAGGVFC